MDKKTIGSTRVFFVFHYYYYHHYQKESVYWIFSSEYPGELSHQGHTGRVSVTITRISAF